MDTKSIFLFGEAEKGEICQPLLIRDLEELLTHLGNPPTPESFGIDFAIQSIMQNHNVIFYRVEEEGYSIGDYQKGAHLLQKKGGKMPLSAIALPGCGEPSIIDLIAPIAKKHHYLLLINESDLYDYLT